MSQQMSFADVFTLWDTETKPAVIAQYGKDDYPALSESWNDLTDSLCKDGQLTALAYHHCPAWDDEMPDDDGVFILAAMGVECLELRVSERPDGLMSDMAAGSSHWRILFLRGQVEFTTNYSMGPAVGGTPCEADVLHSLLMDTSDIEGSTFEEWADSIGYDTDSRKAERIYNACKQTLVDLQTLFTKSELEDLREMFADR